MGSASLDPLSQKAIEAALSNNWKEARELNNSLLKEYPTDIDTLNRLARAYLELGNLSKSTSLYKQVLHLDPYNPIATKNVKKLSEMKASDIKPNEHTLPGTPARMDQFFDEPGKTKKIPLISTKSGNYLKLRITDQVELQPKYNTVLVRAMNGKKIGSLESVWGTRIAKAIRLGCSFEAFITSINPDNTYPVTLFVRETLHSPQLKNETVFPIEKMDDFKPYVSEEALSLVTEQTSMKEDEFNMNDTETKPAATHSLEALASQEQESFDDTDQ